MATAEKGGELNLLSTPEDRGKNWIKFIGTAGARFVMAKQLRSSGGLWFSLRGVNFYMDPGPGALVRCLSARPKLDPTKLDGILLSHKHLDHSGDINALIEAMTEGGYRRHGVLFAPQDALEDDPVILRYNRGYVEKIEILEEHRSYSLGGLKFSTAGKHVHSAETVGFNFQLSMCTLSYITDTKFYPEILAQYPGEILLLNVVLLAPPSHPIDHLSMEDVKVILKQGPAKVVVLTHFGRSLIQAKPWVVADRLSQETGKKVIAAKDGMVLDVDSLLND
jgi:phosphoribosyl 1,2-cyclic phosphodiesterase